MVGQAVYPSGDGYLVTNGGGLDSRDLTFYLPTEAGYTLVTVLTIEAEQVDPDTHRVLTVICRAHQEDGLHAVDMDACARPRTPSAHHRPPKPSGLTPSAYQIRRWPPGGSAVAFRPPAYQVAADDPYGAQSSRAAASRCLALARSLAICSGFAGRYGSLASICDASMSDRIRRSTAAGLRKPCSGASAFRIWLATQDGVPEGETRLNRLSSRSAAGRMRSQSFAAAGAQQSEPSGTSWPQQPPAAH